MPHPQSHVVAPRLLGNYQLLELLDQTETGTVYLALATGLGNFSKPFVVKELRADITKRRGSLASFLNEASLLARLAHPNIVQTLEVGQDRERYFLVTEYLDGQRLNKLIARAAARSKALDLSLHLYLLCEVLSGLTYAHELRDYDGSALGIVHHNVRPHSVIVTYHGQVKLVDFELATLATDPRRPSEGLTDVLSVGIMLWEALAGRHMLQGRPQTQAWGHAPLPRIEDMVPNVHPQLADICHRAIATDADQRFPDAHTFHDELQAHLERITRGRRIDKTKVSQLMAELFEDERTYAQRLLERGLAEVERSLRVVTPASGSAYSSSSEDSSAHIASPALPHIARAETAHTASMPLPWKSRSRTHAKLRPDRRIRGCWLGVLSAVAAAGFAVWPWARNSRTHRDTHKPSAPIQAPASSPSAAADVTQPATAAQPTASSHPILHAADDAPAPTEEHLEPDDTDPLEDRATPAPRSLPSGKRAAASLEDYTQKAFQVLVLGKERHKSSHKGGASTPH